MDLRDIFLLTTLSIFLMLFIFQIILCSLYQIDSKNLNELISNWKKTPILNFSNNSSEEGYNKNDYIIIKGEKIFVKRMEKKYNYVYLKSRGHKMENSLKKCGNDYFNNIIYFKKNEECPINYINLKNVSCGENEKNCLNILSSSINYSNNNTNGEIIIDINSTNENNLSISYISNSNNYIYNNYESIFNIKSRIRIINIISLIIIILSIPFLKISCCKKKCLTYIPYIIFFILSFGLIICFLLIISWIKENNLILEDLNLSKYKIKNRFYIIQIVNLFFIILSTIFIIFYIIKFNLEKYYFNPLILISLISSPIILSPIIIIFIISLKPYYKSGEFNDLKLNYQKSPITEIKINGNFKNI